MNISQWTKEELSQEAKVKRANVKRMKQAITPEQLLEAVKIHTVTEQRAWTWLEGIVWMIEAGEGHGQETRLELHKQALALI